MIERSITVSIHGRYLVEPARLATAQGCLVGFHGYAEPAEIQLERMRAIPGTGSWLLVSVQGLHRFYRGRSRDVVASWMTSQDREQLIEDNRGYLGEVLAAVAREWDTAAACVFAGFSQGVATAFRAAAWSACGPSEARSGGAATNAVAGVIACGGDVPPELGPHDLARIPHALIGRGVHDGWYTGEMLAEDEARLRRAGVQTTTLAFDGAHEWTPAFSAAAGEFLERLRRESTPPPPGTADRTPPPDPRAAGARS